MPFSADQTPIQPPDSPNVQTQIARFRDALRAGSGASDDVRSYDLTWLIHLVGDAHQPLHATQRFSHEHPDGDAGGNLMLIRSGAGCSSFKNLHAFWDGVLGSSESATYAIDQEGRLPRADAAKAKIADERIWIEESVALARSVTYDGVPAQLGDQPFVPSADYKARAMAVSEAQIALAGARLATFSTTP